MSAKSSSKKRVLVVVGYYLPGYKAGGPIRSVSNIIEVLGDEFEFTVLTSDRDIGDEARYPNLPSLERVRVGKAEVYYLPPGPGRVWGVFRLMRDGRFDLIYINSFFSRVFSMLVVLFWKCGAAGRVPLLIAPRGEFSKGALQIKAYRKRFYLWVCRGLGWYRKVSWHVSSRLEAQDLLDGLYRESASSGIVEQTLGKGVMHVAAPVFVASDITAHDQSGTREPSAGSRPRKVPGQLRVIFLSRISRKKNLDFALQVLRNLPGEIDFDIYGPVEDGAYWQECQTIMRGLPPNVRVQHRGDIAHAMVSTLFTQYHVFLFPTLGENFGHVIAEAMLAGCVPVISDQTPWLGLERAHAGWDLPLARPDLYHDALRKSVELDEAGMRALSNGVLEYVGNNELLKNVLADNRTMFERVTLH